MAFKPYRNPPSTIPDHMSEAGARKLAVRVAAYWRGKGSDVMVWAEPNSYGPFATWSVRSNMLNGLPPGEAYRRVA